MNRMLLWVMATFLIASCGSKKIKDPVINPKDSLYTSLNLINDQIKKKRRWQRCAKTEKKTNKHVTVESVDEPDCVDGQPARGVHVLFPFH